MQLSKIHHYFHPAGWPFIALFAVLAVAGWFGGCFIFAVTLLLFAWCLYFFRDPARVTPTRPGLIISPADGKVVAIKELVPDPDMGLGEELRVRISIFLNVFNVHVNRMPADGMVRIRRYRPGAFVNASFDKASVDNERMALVLQLTGEHPYKDKMLGVVQIAGLVARRIVCSAQEGNRFNAGERFGIIRFGSRADVYLPAGMKAHVALGQTMVGGETVLADCLSGEDARIAEART